MSLTRKFRFFAVGLFLTVAFVGNTLSAAVQDLTVDVPKTAYIEWLTASGDTMTSVDGNNTAAFDPYVGGAVTQLTQPANKDAFIGVMCNALTGYTLSLTGTGTTTATTGQMTLAGATPIVYTGSIAQVAGSFAVGATVATNIDLTGATPSATVTFAAESDLPLAAASPNVFTVTASLPTVSTVADGLIMSGTYAGGYTATVALP